MSAAGFRANHAEEVESDSDRKSRLRRNIASAAFFSSPYVIMNALATVVAGYGMLANSAAVVIGAMIIAMLLGPIMGLALAMVDGDVKLLRRALAAEVLGVVMVVVLSAIIGRVHMDLPLTTEILSRTKPNLLDLAVALAGGAAGAYATVSPRVSVGLVGVAISTALVPPLAASGICLSRGHMDLAAGAFILFATNLVAIQCASSVVLFGFGFHRVTHRDPNDKGFFRRLGIDVALFAALAVFLYIQLASTVQQNQFEEAVKSDLEKGLLGIPGAYLAETRFRVIDDADVVFAVVRVPNSITPEETERIEKTLPSRGNKKTRLHVRSLLTKEATSQGYLHEIEPSAPPADEILTPMQQDIAQDLNKTRSGPAPEIQTEPSTDDADIELKPLPSPEETSEKTAEPEPNKKVKN